MFVKEGDAENEHIEECVGEEYLMKNQQGQTGRKIKYTLYYGYENIKKAEHATFKDPSQYQ